MSTERMIGGAAIAFGGFLLLYLIPAQVTSSAGPIDPSLFPRIAAWLFILLGVLQIFVRSASTPAWSWYEFGRLVGISIAVLIAILAMPKVGFLPASITLMAAICAFMFERRTGWLLTTVVLAPAGTWFIFDVVMQRPLPPLPF